MNDNLSSTFPQGSSQEVANYLNIEHSPSLTASELAQLWTSYMEYTMLRCQWKYFLVATKTAAVKGDRSWNA